MERKSLFNKLTNILLFVSVILLTLNLLFVMKTRFKVNNQTNNWDKLKLVLEQIDNNYVDSIDYHSLTDKIIPIVLEQLDPHSLYLPPTELQAADESLDGNFEGIGIEFNVPEDTAVVIAVITGGPSEKAGLQAGDKLLKVNGKSVAGVKFSQDSLVKRLRGKSGTIVSVDVKRYGVSEPVSFKIKRGRIPVKSIDVAYMTSSKQGYIKLSRFSRTSHSEFVEAIKDLKKSGLEELILDLRGNTGGYMDQALLLSNEFLKSGDLIVYMQGRMRSREEFRADSKGECKNLKLKILIDENSASSSEILAGAIQDNDRGIILGRRSFGKGLVQEPINFTDNSGIRLTVARFYTPTGRSIQKPFSPDYRNDIVERYKHGEMMVADSIKKDSTHIFKTPKGKIVYGGGGIIPDLFIPMDTAGVNSYFVKIVNMGLPYKFAAKYADENFSSLRAIKDIKSLNNYFLGKDIEQKFLEYLSFMKVPADPKNWNVCKKVAMTQVKAYIGRYTPLEDKAFYPIIAEIDNVMERALIIEE